MAFFQWTEQNITETRDMATRAKDYANEAVFKVKALMDSHWYGLDPGFLVNQTSVTLSSLDDAIKELTTLRATIKASELTEEQKIYFSPRMLEARLLAKRT